MMSMRWFFVGNFLVLAGLMIFAAVSCEKQEPAASQNSTSTPGTVASTGATNNSPDSPASAGGMVELKIELPSPRFQGTPRNIKEENMEPANIKFDPIMAPAGAINLAQGKKVTASDTMPIMGELVQITDGDKEALDGNFVEFMQGTQWVQVDLEQECPIYAVGVWHNHSAGRVFHDVIIQLSNDKDFLNDVTTIYNNDYDNSSKLGVGADLQYVDSYKGKIADAKGTKARYVRFYSNGSSDSDANQYTEVEVWGVPAK